MVIEHNTDNNGKDLSGSDDKRDDVLFKLLDHAVDKDLADGG